VAKVKQGSGGAAGRDYKAGPGGLGAKGFAVWYRDLEIKRLQELDLEAVASMAAVLEDARKNGRRVFLAGNGGSAALASGFGTDFCKTAAADGKPLLKALALTDSGSYITAVGNDIGYESVFSRQLENWLEKGDVVLLISGSGNSANVIKAAELAKARGAKVLAMTGFDGGRLKPLADVCLHVPCDQYGVVEDMHQAACHMLTFHLRQSR
jgi:D-sedoheptulose 7-phosphate isomerase